MSTAALTPVPRKTQVSVPRGVSIRLDDDVVIPPGIVDHESYRSWARSVEFPSRVRLAFFHNQIWTDSSMEQAYTHNLVKFQIGRVLASLVEEAGNGHFFTDGMLLSNLDAGFTTIPDGMFVSFEAFEADRIREVEGAENGCVEFEGTPDMVLEVVSRFSEKKDAEFISLYHKASVREYWLADVRRNPVQFDIFVKGSRRFTVNRRQAGGWLKSSVFGRSFRLTQAADRRDKPIYALEMRG
jgi:Uma2 family endonuclease